eukprot:796046-Pyramimonas_sp.AAC.1
MAVSQNSPSSLDYSSVTLERTLAHVLGIVGSMPRILSPPAGLGAWPQWWRRAAEAAVRWPPP